MHNRREHKKENSPTADWSAAATAVDLASLNQTADVVYSQKEKGQEKEERGRRTKIRSTRWNWSFQKKEKEEVVNTRRLLARPVAADRQIDDHFLGQHS